MDNQEVTQMLELLTAKLVVRIPGEPIGQGRPRAAVVAGKPRIYSPKRSSKWRARAALFMQQEAKVAGRLDGPVRMVITAVFTLPKSRHSKKNPVTRRTACTKTPDFDNIAKAVCDAGNGILYADDAQVADCRVLKLYGYQGEEPYVLVAVGSC